jgi:DNA replication protein DnaC
MDNNEHTILWLPKYKSCSKCTNGFIVNEGIGKKCQCRVDYDNELKFIYSLLNSNVIQEFSSEYQYTFLKNYTLDSYCGPDSNGNKQKIKKYIDEFNSKFNSINLFLSGEPGTQKTTIAKYILCSILRQNKTGYYIIANDLFNLLTDSERNEEARIKLQSIIINDLLIIDEFDESKITLYSSDWKQKFILPFLKQRLETIHKSTIFISNRLPSELGEKFEGAIQDLIVRETLDDSVLIFEDKYAKYRERVNIKSIWDDDDSND